MWTDGQKAVHFFPKDAQMADFFSFFFQIAFFNVLLGLWSFPVDFLHLRPYFGLADRNDE